MGTTDGPQTRQKDKNNQAGYYRSPARVFNREGKILTERSAKHETQISYKL